MSSEKFYDKVVVVTGSSAGIGQAIALLFASRGARVTVSGRNKERLESVLQQLSEVIVPNCDRSEVNVAGRGKFLAVSKIALDHLTRCLAAELGPKGVRVNSVNPGFIPTLVLRHYSQDVVETNSKIQEVELKDQALKERTGTVADVAELVAFLVSDAASFITGECIKVDGGRSLGPPIDWSPVFADK